MKVLITGGTGSFGRYAAKQFLSEWSYLHELDEVRIFSRDEEKQISMKREFNHPKLTFMIGDVRDFGSLMDAVKGIDIVVHAAALKQIPICEKQPLEAIKTNLEGTRNVREAAEGARISKSIFLSTDKAVNPVNVYGATKMLAERVWLRPSSFESRFCAARYGNIIGSRGSVIPLFKRQISQNKPLTLTHPDMTRFFITLPDAFWMVCYAIDWMRGGEIYVPKIKSCRVLDLAKIVSGKDYQIKYIGVRPGEKIHETLVSEDELRRTEDKEQYYVIHPHGTFDSGRIGETLNSLGSERLTREEMQQMLADDEECEPA